MDIQSRLNKCLNKIYKNNKSAVDFYEDFPLFHITAVLWRLLRKTADRNYHFPGDTHLQNTCHKIRRKVIFMNSKG